MNIDDMLYFVTVVKHGNITKAAKEIFISQPTLSRRIKALEEEFGAALLKRVNNKIFITKAGELCQASFEKVLTDISQLHERIDSLCNQITIGVYYCGDASQIDDIIIKWKQQNSNVTFRQIRADLELMIHSLKADEVDMVVSQRVVFTGMDSGFEYSFVESARMYLIVPCNHPLAKKKSISFKELNDSTVVSLSPYISPISLKEFEKWLTANGFSIKLQPNEDISDFSSLFTYVAPKNKLGFICWNFPQNYHGNKHVALIPIEESFDGFNIVIAYKKKNKAKLQSFLSKI